MVLLALLLLLLLELPILVLLPLLILCGAVPVGCDVAMLTFKTMPQTTDTSNSKSMTILCVRATTVVHGTVGETVTTR